ncbi:16S rRNA (adenine(1518)-N(6)/adenine(1519)-N(6))-dimethyltransferase RsmA [Flagellimonas meishanensis]|uniref:16S rRNA (adenine(1518)-N(6)/adenine(1519)-N(6))- dimethyltransferase RsmA n=1 Tax=Flagellimonas meishanensis TaxID=2873264 RepID=UPI001CA6BE59|nr:16S rRNA (adenine(1518)-N(6)/adenine(1519)-N(6))-dimethyltransferase RsmA [[Muricauda] meishanensis]
MPKKLQKHAQKPRSGHTAVKAKKHLGQHFLNDEEVAQKIANTLSLQGYTHVLEIGPGMGVLTKHLLLRDMDLVVMDLDEESIIYLNHSFRLEYAQFIEKNNRFKIVEADFLNFDLKELFGDAQFAITGNFPYNISSQIVFKMLEMRHQVPEFSGMFQKEVAMRICAAPGNKTYGILSVLVQAFYDAEYLFSVPPEVFDPPPKVHSGVLRLTRKKALRLPCDEKLFFKVVKTAFNQRRKTMRNSLKTLNLSNNLKEDTIFDQRPEQLHVTDFITLTQKIANDPI